jgi:energy-coupling factor transporter ATP-binding protein EcfA2
VTRSELIYALTEKMADPTKKHLVDEMMYRLLDLLESEDIEELSSGRRQSGQIASAISDLRKVRFNF